TLRVPPPLPGWSSRPPYTTLFRSSVLKPDTTPGPGDDGYEGYNNSKKVPCIGKLREVFGEDCADAYESQSRSNENGDVWTFACRSEEHTSELQSRENLVCRLLAEK